MEYISNSEKDTKLIAKKISKQIKNGVLITLSGDLGAGKTIFTRHLIKALKVKADVLSPTFVLERVYSNKKKVIHHYDLYRLTSLNQVLDLAISENLESGETCIIEWPEIAESILPENRIDITIQKLGDNTRKFVIKEK